MEAGAIASELHDRIVHPLVVGGPMRPGRPFGGRALVLLGSEAQPADTESLGHTQWGRVRAARAIVPIDLLPPPSDAEWLMAAVFHDLVQCTHPDLPGAFSADAPRELAVRALGIVARVPYPTHVKQALARHTIFARMFELTRGDTEVSYWAGKRTYRGTAPPQRLLQWPDLRRVRVRQERHAWTALVPPVAREEHTRALSALLDRSPLTDLATCTHPARHAPFAWSPATLALVSSPVGTTLATRALARLKDMEVDDALGRATLALMNARALDPLRAIADLLAERALSRALQGAALDLPSEGPGALARAFGAWAGRTRLQHDAWSSAHTQTMKPVLDIWANTPEGRRLAQWLSA